MPRLTEEDVAQAQEAMPNSGRFTWTGSVASTDAHANLTFERFVEAAQLRVTPPTVPAPRNMDTRELPGDSTWHAHDRETADGGAEDAGWYVVREYREGVIDGTWLIRQTEEARRAERERLRAQARPRIAPDQEIDFGNLKFVDVEKLEKTNRYRYLKPFHLDYQSLEEARLRLAGTLVDIHGHPFYIRQVYQKKKEYVLLVNDEDGNQLGLIYDKGVNLRSISPSYFNYRETTLYLKRTPGPVYKQGLSRDNVQITEVGKASPGGFFRDVSELVYPLKHRKIVKFSEEIPKLWETLPQASARLNDNIAIFKKSARILVEYKGRPLGRLNDNELKLLDPDDGTHPWIINDLNEVNLTARGT